MPILQKQVFTTFCFIYHTFSEVINNKSINMCNDLQRVLIMGNSGSGKSWLAARISEFKTLPVTDLDTLYWEQDGYGRAREKTEVIKDVLAIANKERWIIEGVYGWIADQVSYYASHVIWLTPKPSECVENIEVRGIRNNGSVEDYKALLEWASLYEIRTGSSSYEGHLTVFSKVSPENQIKLASREDINQFLTQL
ncbi:adenylate kinase [Pantoea sp. RIT413]|nr:adenylate kinase [Pantoea sp. RIT 413]